jgi:hypothetical protein
MGFKVVNFPGYFAKNDPPILTGTLLLLPVLVGGLNFEKVLELWV